MSCVNCNCYCCQKERERDVYLAQRKEEEDKLELQLVEVDGVVCEYRRGYLTPSEARSYIIERLNGG